MGNTEMWWNRVVPVLLELLMSTRCVARIKSAVLVALGTHAARSCFPVAVAVGV